MEPQHFQQQERYLENLIYAQARSFGAYTWGICELEIDEGLLEQGKLAIKRAKGIFPDGTVFDMPAQDPLPLPLELNDSCQNKMVCLSVLSDMPGNPWIDLTRGDGGSRYRAIDSEIQDRNVFQQAEGNPRNAMLQLGQLQTRLSLRDNLSANESMLPLAMIGERSAEGSLVLNSKILPPMLDFRATGWLNSAVSELQGLISLRLNSVRLPDAHYAGGGMSEVLELMLVQLLGEYHLVLTHLLRRPRVHPEELYQLLLGLLGRLCIIPGSEAIRERNDLHYSHERPDIGYFQLFAALRRALSLVIESPAVAMPFKSSGDNLYLCQNDGQLRLERLIFAVSADIPAEVLRRDFPAQIKLGPVEKIIKLIDLQLPGVRLAALGAPPRHIPYYPDSVYFEVDPSDALYKEMMAGAAIAFSVVGDFPALRFDVWGLRPGRGR